MTKELARRFAITIGALLIFRLGSHIPIPGMSTPNSSLSSSALVRLSILSLNLVPYLSAAIIIQLVSMVWGRLSSLERSGEKGRNRIARYTLILTLPIAGFQAFGVASAIARIPGLIADPDGWFLLSATASMVGGVFFAIWLAELITRHGIGNGLALLLSIPILVSLPADVANVLVVMRQGAVSPNLALFHAMFWVAVIAIMVCIEGARRNVPVEFAGRKAEGRVLSAQRSVLPIKLNSAGFLIPATVVPWVLTLPLYLAAQVFGNTPALVAAYKHLQFGQPAHLIIGSVVLFIVVFVYAAYVLDPERVAEQLGKRGGAIPGVEPGEPTADYLDRVVSLTTVIGAIYLVSVWLVPEAFAAFGGMLPYKFSGGSALIVVCTILDLQKQVRDVSLTNPRGERR
jgi:preprotein translocase subunit SecY